MDLWPAYLERFAGAAGVPEEQDGSNPRLEILKGSFGLIAGWSKDTQIARRTYNTRSETAAVKPSFRNVWRKAQHCIISAQAIYKPDWRSGAAVPARVTRADGELMGIAVFWERWFDPSEEIVFSYTMLTVDAGNHELMRSFHRPED